MLNYKKYIAQMGLSNNDVIAALEKEFPKFSKIQCSMISSPEKYGLALSTAAEKHLLSTFGKPKRKSKPRTRSTRLSVSLTPEQYQLVMDSKGDLSPQEYISSLIVKETP